MSAATPDYAAVLNAIRPASEWTLNANDYSQLVWLSDDPKPTKATLDAAWPQVEYDRALAKVKAARQARYTAETDPLYFKAQRGEDGTTLDDWQAKVAEIKADLPYPEPPAA